MFCCISLGDQIHKYWGIPRFRCGMIIPMCCPFCCCPGAYISTCVLMYLFNHTSTSYIFVLNRASVFCGGLCLIVQNLPSLQFRKGKSHPSTSICRSPCRTIVEHHVQELIVFKFTRQAPGNFKVVSKGAGSHRYIWPRPEHRCNGDTLEKQFFQN